MSEDVLGTMDGKDREIGQSKDVQGCPCNWDMGREGQGDEASVGTWDGLRMSLGHGTRAKASVGTWDGPKMPKDVLGTWEGKDRG